MWNYIKGLFSKAEAAPSSLPAPETPKPTTERLPNESTGQYLDRLARQGDFKASDVGELGLPAAPAPKPTGGKGEPINDAGLALIKSFETYVGYVYDDLVPAVKGVYREWDGGAAKGTLTIGYGHTNSAAHPLKIKKGLRVTEAEAAEILRVDLEDCAQRVDRLVKVPLTPNQRGALISFEFNTGSLGSSTLLKKLNAGDYGAAPSEMMKWVNSKGVKLNGLVRRRQAEVDLGAPWKRPA